MIKYAVILALSDSSHQSRLTYNRPHTMLPALGKPLVVRIMERLHRIGILNYVVVLGEQEGEVASYLNRSWFPDAEIKFMLKSNTESLVKTLGDIARQYQQPLVITSYNCFTHHNLPEHMLKSYTEGQAELILSGASTTLSNSTQHYYALMQGRGVLGIFDTQPATAEGQNALLLNDLAICGSAFIDYLAAVPQTRPLTASQHFMGITRQYIADGGSSKMVESAWTLPVKADTDLLTLNKHLLDEGQNAHILSELPGTVQITPPVRIDPQVSIGHHAQIGPNVYLERGCSVGEHSIIRNAMILQSARVPARQQVENAIIATRAEIHA